jgi:hypothetical protein
MNHDEERRRMAGERRLPRARIFPAWGERRLPRGYWAAASL